MATPKKPTPKAATAASKAAPKAAASTRAKAPATSAPKPRAKAAPKPAAKAASKAATKPRATAASKATAKGTPKPRTKAAPKATAKATPKARAKAAPKATPAQAAAAAQSTPATEANVPAASSHGSLPLPTGTAYPAPAGAPDAPPATPTAANAAGPAAAAFAAPLAAQSAPGGQYSAQGQYPPTAQADEYGSPLPPLDPDQERKIAFIGHLIAAGATFFTMGVAGFLVTLVLYLVYMDRGPFVRKHLAGALNVQIVTGIIYVISLPLIAVGLGLVFWFLAVLWATVLHIIGALRANEGRWWSPPLTPRFVR